MSSNKQSNMSNKVKSDNIKKQEIIKLYTNSSPKLLTRGQIKKSTLDKILEDINANCKKKK